MHHSRDARKILDAASGLFSQHGRVTSIDDIFTAEEMAFSFFAAPVINVIQHVFRKSKSEDRFTLAYYLKPVRSMIKNRRREDWTMTDANKAVYWLVAHSVLQDFSHDHLIMLRTLCDKPIEDVREAVEESNRAGVYSIPYIVRVQEGIEARREEKRRKIAERRRMFVNPTANIQIHKRSRAELAHLVDSWEQAIQNVELQRLVNEQYGRGSE